MSLIAKIAKQPLSLFVTSTCPFCNGARKLAAEKRVNANVVFLDAEPQTDLRQKLTELTGQKTVPYVFSHDKFIGGFSELKKQPQEFWDLLSKE